MSKKIKRYNSLRYKTADPTSGKLSIKNYVPLSGSVRKHRDIRKCIGKLLKTS